MRRFSAHFGARSREVLLRALCGASSRTRTASSSRRLSDESPARVWRAQPLADTLLAYLPSFRVGNGVPEVRPVRILFTIDPVRLIVIDELCAHHERELVELHEAVSVRLE